MPHYIDSLCMLARPAVIGLMALTGLVAIARGQDEAPASPRFAEARGLAGPHALAPGRWGLAGISATNKTDEPGWLRANCYFAQEPYLQFGRELWVPPQARRWSWCPVRVPDNVPPGPLEIRSVAEDRTGPQVQRLSPPEGGLWAASSVPGAPSPVLTGMIGGGSADRADQQLLDLVGAARQTRALKPRLVWFWNDFISPSAEGLGALSQLVVCGDQPAGDVVGCAAIRDWVRGGGKLWIMLDQVRPETVRSLLGDAVGYQVVDRVGLTTIEICKVSGDVGAFSVAGPRDYDQPVEFLRVLVHGVDQEHAVNGWPASFWLDFGRGRVLCTTLGARGWLEPRGTRGPWKPGDDGPVANDPLRALAAEFLREPKPPAVPPEQVAAVLSEQVGYRILGRGVVLAILGGFCATIIVAGVWLARREQLERLGWLGPAGGGLAAGLLVALGFHARASVPPTVAVFEHVQADAGSDELSVCGRMALYQPEPGRVVPHTLPGGFLQPDMTGLERSLRRAVWQDQDAWHWETLTLPAGVRFADFRQTVQVAEPPVARGTFGPDGFCGTLLGPWEGGGDAVVIGPSGGNQAVRLEANGRFLIPAGDELARGQFIAASLLTDDQRRRQGLYEQLFSTTTPPPVEPQLYLWSQPLTMAISLPDNVRQTGSALVRLPVRVERPPAGTRCVIPSPFVEYRAVQGTQRAHASAYQNVTRKWLSMQIPAETWLRFQVPADVLPFALERATLTVQVDAPMRSVEILRLAADNRVVLRTWQGPRGKLRLTLDQPEALTLDAAGGLTLGVRVGGPAEPPPPGPLSADNQGPQWSIESVALELAGRR